MRDISGTVTDGVDPIEGATVMAIDRSADTVAESVHTDAAGEYTVTVSGDVLVVAHHIVGNYGENYGESYHVASGDAFYKSRHIPLSDSDTAQTAHFTLDPFDPTHGAVTLDVGTPTTIAPPEATATTTTTQPSTTTSQNPAITPPSATATPMGTVPTTTSQITTTTAPPTTSSTETAAPVSVSVTGKGEITGTVYQSGGESGLENATVVAILNGEVDATATTASDGSFSLVVSDETEAYHVATLAPGGYYSYPYTTASEY